VAILGNSQAPSWLTVLEPINAWGRPLVGGDVVDGETVNVLVNTCESAEEREDIIRRTGTCMLKIY
jgi:hypothetical protein